MLRMKSPGRCREVAIRGSSTVFYFVLLGSCFGLRWFTPKCEVALCGHATLASAAVLFNSIGENPGGTPMGRGRNAHWKM